MEVKYSLNESGIFGIVTDNLSANFQVPFERTRFQRGVRVKYSGEQLMVLLKRFVDIIKYIHCIPWSS